MGYHELTNKINDWIGKLNQIADTIENYGGEE